MDPNAAVALPPSHSLEAANAIPIAELCPDVADPASKAVGGVVTITWPYNKVKGTFAFTLAEPDFRLRRNKGQVRVDFTGRAATAVGDCGLGSNDEVLISLAGAAWEAESTNKRRSLPGAEIGWKLVFSETVLLRVKRADTSEIDFVVVNEQPHKDETTLYSTQAQSLDTTKSLSSPAPPSPIHIESPVREINTKRLHDGEFASPAFVRRARMSYGSLFEDGFDIFQEDGGVKGRGRKRTRFGRDSSAWRYTSQSPSPEPVASSPSSADEQDSSPTRVVKSPVTVETAGEAYQTTGLAESSPPPTITTLEAEADMIVPKPTLVNDALSDTPAETALEQRTQTPPSNVSPPEPTGEPTIHNTPAAISNEVSPHDLEGPIPIEAPHSEYQLGSSGYNFPGNPWNADVAPAAFDPPQKTLSSSLHVNETFAYSGFETITSDNQPIPFNEPGALSQLHPEDGGNQESVNDHIIHSTELEPPSLEYPPLEATEDTHPQSFHDEALTNYPASYLEDSHISQPSQMIKEQTPHNLTAPEVGSRSWATVNPGSQATLIPPPDRFGSRDGDTPEQALVIDESDSEPDSGLEPTAVEDTVNNGRAYDLDAFEDAEAEDEVDAQYSDDDEPEYDEDEMGGDYDTRNYEQPADDDDDSHDDDLKSHPLDPEFEAGESWDEEEQEEFLDEEDEGEYEMDEEIAEPGPRPIIQATPTVIDLISSSEDEGEDEDDEEEEEDEDDRGNNTNFPPPGIHINSGTFPDHQQATIESSPQQAHLNDERFDIISQAPISEADSASETGSESYEDTGFGEDDGEEKDDEVENDEEREDEETTGDRMKFQVDEQEKVLTPEPWNTEAKQHGTEPEIELRHETEPKGDQLPSGTHDEENLLSQQIMPIVELHESISIETTLEAPVEGSDIVPLSAADGLEMLSRAVDEESIAHGHSVSADSIVEKEVAEPIHEHSPTESPEEGSIQTQQPPNDQSGVSEAVPEIHTQSSGGYQFDQTASPEPDTEHPPLAVSDGNLEIIAPSSPPLTQSFQSHVEDDKSAYEKTTLISTAEITTAQLATPLDTQLTDSALIATANTSMNMGESFESRTTVEHQILEGMEGSLEKPVERLAPKDVAPPDTNMAMDEGDVEKERDSGLAMELEARLPSDEPSAASSPAASFQTQVDDEELALPSDIEQTKESGQLPRRPSLEYNSSASDTGKSFASYIELDEELQASILEESHLEVDEELQASILEDSQLEEYFIHGPDDEYDEPAQIDASEADVESQYTDQAETALSPLRDNTPSMQLAEEVSTQLRRNFIEKGSSPGDDSDASTRNDPSVSLARAANASRKRKRGTSTPLYRPRKRLFDARRSPTPETDDSSVRLARASLTSQGSTLEEDSYSMTAAKLQLARHLRDELTDCTPLKGLRHHLTKSLDVIAVAVMQPPDPQRAKNGPREYMMSFTMADHTIGPYAVVEALIYRPHKDTLPVVKYGDVVLLRNFTVVSLSEKGFGLRSNDGSSWAVFDYEDEPAQIRGPPVEYNEREALYVDYLREWFKLLDVKARSKLERANKEIISAGKSK
ncbi:hypothetical protein F5Y10DRAFT_254773 [Nemania abortiva]|nr:hypothetical protein F5Y10DRAFT_254773 [Nemania abortiva]